jgi:Phosphotransferase enzyme family
MEAVRPDRPLPSAWRWTPREAVSHEDVQAALGEIDDYRFGRKAGMFARPGWLHDLYAWATPHLPAGFHFTGRFEQWNCGPTFCLARFELAPHGAVWLKAVGDPNLREFSVTPALAARHPSWLPRVLATHADWHAMLLEHVDTPSLFGRTDREYWCHMARTLAEMQIEWLDDVSGLLALGCADCRFDTLAHFTNPFFAAMEEVCAAQPTSQPERLTRAELRRLAESVGSVCARLARLSMSASLGNGDLNPHNILFGEGRLTFLDWAAAYVGHPFLTFDSLRHRLSRDHPEAGDLTAEVTHAYASRWMAIYSRDAVEEALRLAPVVAPLVCAFLCSHETGRFQLDDRRHGLYRSLTRLVGRELDALSALEVCR